MIFELSGEMEMNIRMRRDVDSKKVILLAFGTASFFSLCFAKYVLNLEIENCEGFWLWIKNSNLHFYLSMLMCWGGAFFAVRIIFFPFSFVTNNKIYELSLKKQGLIVAVLTGTLVAFLLQWFLVEQFEEYPYSASLQPIFSIPAGLAISLFSCGFIIAFYMIIKRKDISGLSLFVLYAFCLIVSFYSTYYVNIFKIEMHHAIAVLESIYNVCDLTPYAKETTGIYGHYALFFLLPVRLSHGSPYVVAGMMAIFECITAVSVFYVCHSLLPSNWLRAFVACAFVFYVATFGGGGPYWQIRPIRDMFPMLMSAYFLMLNNRKGHIWKTKWIWIGYTIASLAILWNTESGMFCMLAFSAYIIAEQLQAFRWYEKKMLFLYIEIILLCVCSVIVSVGIVNIYNLFCGGKLIFRVFFTPLFTETYINGISYSMPWGNHAWLYVLCLFFVALTWGLYHTSMFKKTEDDMSNDAPLSISLAILGLLTFSYYANRAAWGNLCICFCQALCINALVIKQTWIALNKWEKNISFDEFGKKVLAIVSIIIITSLGIQMPLFPIQMVKETHSLEARTMDNVMADLTVMSENLPPNTYGVGTGISVLYHMLGWDNYAHVTDFSDLSIAGEDAVNVILDEIMQEKGFLLSDVGVNVSANERVLTELFRRDPTYRIVQTFLVQEHEFHYYLKE